MTYDIEDSRQQVREIQDRVELNASKLDEIVNSIIEPYCKDLDRYVEFIKDILKDGENPPTEQELDDFCLNLSVYIYYASDFY